MIEMSRREKRRDEDGPPHGLIVFSISTGEMTINA